MGSRRKCVSGPEAKNCYYESCEGKWKECFAFPVDGCFNLYPNTRRNHSEKEGTGVAVWRDHRPSKVKNPPTIPTVSTLHDRCTLGVSSSVHLSRHSCVGNGGSWFKCATPQVSCSERKFLWYYTYI